MTVAAIEHISLDGVMPAPARPAEAPRGGFSHGGWSLPYGDKVMAEVMSRGRADGARGGGALLLGRRTYTDFAAVWPA